MAAWIAASSLVGCSWHAGTGGGYYTVGDTQSQVISSLSSQHRVLFRDDDLMIVEDARPAPGDPARTSTLRFRDGKLDTWSHD